MRSWAKRIQSCSYHLGVALRVTEGSLRPKVVSVSRVRAQQVLDANSPKHVTPKKILTDVSPFRRSALDAGPALPFLGRAGLEVWPRGVLCTLRVLAHEQQRSAPRLHRFESGRTRPARHRRGSHALLRVSPERWREGLGWDVLAPIAADEVPKRALRNARAGTFVVRGSHRPLAADFPDRLLGCGLILLPARCG
jgi:hypothetical protein